MTQGASHPWSWAPKQPPNGVAAPAHTPTPGLHPRTPEHPFVTERHPFREPSAPPSVPKYSRGSVLHIRDMSAHHAIAGPQGWGSIPQPDIHKEPLQPPSPTSLQPFNTTNPQCKLSGVKAAPQKFSSCFPKHPPLWGQIYREGLDCFDIQSCFCREYGRCWFAAHQSCVSIA